MSETIARSSFEGLKTGTGRALTSTGAPVLGFRAIRVFRWRILKVPNPRTSMFFCSWSASLMASRKASTTRAQSFLEMVGPAVRALWHRAVGSKDAVALNLLIDFILPSHAVQISLAFVSLALAVLCCGLSSWQTTVAASLLLAYFLYFIVGALLARLPLRVYLDVLVAPAYIAWRTWIYLTSRTGRSRWK